MVSDSKSDVRKHRGFKSLPVRHFKTLANWRDDRVAEGARLEIVCTERYRGFESLSLRVEAYAITCVILMVPGDAEAVNPARPGREQR